MDPEIVKQALNDGDISKVAELTGKALEEGADAKTVLDTLIGGMDRVGAKFRNNEIFIPEVMISAKAMQAGLNVLSPFLSKSGIKPVGTVTIGTVKGDLHDIGKNLVSMMLRGAGFEIIDLGIDVPPERFTGRVKGGGVDIVAMSSLITTSMASMKHVIEELRKQGLLAGVKTMVGGAPVTQEFARSIGADGYADDASGAVAKARELIGLLRSGK